MKQHVFYSSFRFFLFQSHHTERRSRLTSFSCQFKQMTQVLERAAGLLSPAPQRSFRTSSLRLCESTLYVEQTLCLIRDKYERSSPFCTFRSGLAEVVTYTSGWQVETAGKVKLIRSRFIEALSSNVKSISTNNKAARKGPRPQIQLHYRRDKKGIVLPIICRHTACVAKVKALFQNRQFPRA